MGSVKKKPLPQLVWDEAYWRHRAEEARAIEANLRHPECRRIMLEIAESYDRLAKLTTQFRSAARERREREKREREKRERREGEGRETSQLKLGRSSLPGGWRILPQRVCCFRGDWLYRTV